MVTILIWTLIYICVAALVVFLVLHVLSVLEIPIPAKAVQIIWLIFMLLAVLALVNVLLGHGGIRLGWSGAIEHADVAQRHIATPGWG